MKRVALGCRWALARSARSPGVAAGLQADAARRSRGAHRPRRRQRRAGARRSRCMMEKEKLLPVRMQVVEQARRRRRGGRGVPGREEGRDPHHRLLHRRVAHQPAHQRRGQGHAEGPHAGRAPGARAGGDRGQGRRALQDARRLRRPPRRRSPGELKQSGGSITSRDNVVRQLLQKNSGARWAVHLVPRRRRAHRRAARRATST